MNKRLVSIAAISAALAVIFGAFGAHALKSLIGPAALGNWETAVQYHFIHTLALLALGLMPANQFINRAAWCFGLGIVLFSGSLYLLSLREILEIPVAILGPVTPFGGLLLIIAWCFLAISGFKKN
jgi:uncharacterized membrane protein YgdD (TMEM256/DUF423 family)